MIGEAGLGTNHLTLSPGAADLGRLYPWFEALAGRFGLTQSQAFRAQLVLEEAVGNAALHGFDPGQPGSVVIEAEMSADRVMLTVRDNGRAFDPCSAPERPAAATLEEAEPGGRGLRLMRRYCSDLSYRRTSTGNELTMVIDLNPSDAGR